MSEGWAKESRRAGAAEYVTKDKYVTLQLCSTVEQLFAQQTKSPQLCTVKQRISFETFEGNRFQISAHLKTLPQSPKTIPTKLK